MTGKTGASPGSPYEPDVLAELTDLTGSVGAQTQSLLANVPAFVLAQQEWPEPWEISIVLTSDEHLRQVHADFLDDDGLTDVMTFDYGKPDKSRPRVGEIVISVDRAAVQAREGGWPTDQELLFLTIHGMLHLCGWDDGDAVSRSGMLRRQEQLLALLTGPPGD